MKLTSLNLMKRKSGCMILVGVKADDFVLYSILTAFKDSLISLPFPH